MEDRYRFPSMLGIYSGHICINKKLSKLNLSHTGFVLDLNKIEADFSDDIARQVCYYILDRLVKATTGESVMDSRSSSFHPMQNVLFKTPKHDSHDSQWLFPGLSAQLVCFGCAVELLEKNLVNVQKKLIVQELLQIFLRNSKILKLMLGKMEIFLRVWNILLAIIVENGEVQLSELACECCIIVLKGTKNELNVDNLLDTLVNSCTTFENASLVRLLKSVIVQHPPVLEILCNEKGSFVNSLLTSLGANRAEPCSHVWDLLTSVLTHLQELQDLYVTPAILQRIIDLCVVSIAEKDMDTEILGCLFAFLGLPNSREILHHYETSNLTTSSKSVLHFFKKMLMSTSTESQIIAIKCVTVAAHDVKDGNPEFTSLQNLCLEKGIAEYLLELLSSTNTKVIQELFICLEVIAHCKKFYTLGHVVYGFPAIVNAVSKLSNTDALYNGLCLIDVMMRNSKDFENCNIVKQQLIPISKLLKKTSTEFVDEKIKLGTSTVFLSLLHCTGRILIGEFQIMLDIVESLFLFMEASLTPTSKVLVWHSEFVTNCYESVFLISEVLFECVANGCDDTDSIAEDVIMPTVNILYYLFDRYVIPQAITKLSSQRSVSFQKRFYQTLLLILEMIPDRGKLLATKLSRSSFISITYDSKVLAFQNNYVQDELFGKILAHLCISVDNNQSVLEINLLLSHLLAFNAPVHEWKPLFEPSKGNTTMDYHAAMLILIACSDMAGCPIISMQHLHQCIEVFASNSRLLNRLSTIGKRYLLYIFCQMDATIVPPPICSTDKKHSLISLLSESSLDANILFHQSNLFLVWLLQLPAPVEFFAKCLQVYFCGNLCKTDDDDDCFEQLKDILHSKDILFPFIETCVSTIGKYTEEIVLDKIMTCTTFLVSFVPIEKMNRLRHQINLHLLLNDPHHQVNATFLIKLLNTSEVSTDNYIADEGLKILFRISSYVDKKQKFACQLEALNFIYLIITKSRLALDPKPTSFLVNSSHIVSFLKNTVFSNNERIKNCRESLLLERVTAAIMLTTSELIICTKQFHQNPLSKIMVPKQLAIDYLVCSDLPVVQYAMLIFWTQLFEAKIKSPFIQLVDDLGQLSPVTSHDIQLVALAVQGLYLNHDVVVQKAAAECFSSLTNFFHQINPQFLRGPWNQAVWRLVEGKLSSHNYDIPQLVLVNCFIFASDVKKSNLFKLALDIVEKCPPDGTSCERDVMVLSIVQTLVKRFLNELEYTTLRRLKSALKLFQKKFGTSALTKKVHIKYVNINGVVALSYGCQLERSDVNKTTKIIERRMDEIDDDQTESDEEMKDG